MTDIDDDREQEDVQPAIARRYICMVCMRVVEFTSSFALPLACPECGNRLEVLSDE